VLAKRKYEKNYTKKIKTDSGEVRIYDDAHIAKRWEKKVGQISALKKNLPKLQHKYRADLKSDDLKIRTIAAIVAILDLTAMRIGNDGSVEDFGTFGATTLKKKHIKISGNTVKFNFLGKKKVDQTFSFTDAGVAKVLKELLKGKSNNDFVFEYEDGKRIRAKVVNRYLAAFNITAKDLRGFHANQLMRDELKHTKDFEKALEQVSDRVGHEPKTLMNQYLDPALVKRYKKAALSLADYINSELSSILQKQPKSMAPLSTKPKSSAPGKSTPLRPGEQLAGGQKITSPYGMRTHPRTKKRVHHDGVDLRAAKNTEILAYDDGIAVFAGRGNAYSGNMVTILHGPDQRLATKYLHLNKVLVSPGASVSKGQVIGLAGSTGRVTGAHLHFVMEYDSQVIDPTPYLKDRTVVGAMHAREAV
jgi:murein DD-endopeptidase MepM/ murein hydrolase activator NlpD